VARHRDRPAPGCLRQAREGAGARASLGFRSCGKPAGKRRPPPPASARFRRTPDLRARARPRPAPGWRSACISQDPIQSAARATEPARSLPDSSFRRRPESSACPRSRLGDAPQKSLLDRGLRRDDDCAGTRVQGNWGARWTHELWCALGLTPASGRAVPEPGVVRALQAVR
jgi:hypothetical protein